MTRRPPTCARITGSVPGPTPRSKARPTPCGAPAIATTIAAATMPGPRPVGEARCAAHLPPLETPLYRATRTAEFARYQVESRRATYTREMARVVAGLRRLADEAERQAAPDYAEVRHGGPTAVVRDLTNDVLWGVANLRLPALSRTADELQTAERALAAADQAMADLTPPPAREEVG